MVVKNFINKIKHGGGMAPKPGFKQKVSRIFMTNAQKKVANTTISQKKVDKYTTIATKKQGAIEALKTRLADKQRIVATLKKNRTANNSYVGSLKRKNKLIKTEEGKQKRINAIDAQIKAKQGRMNTKFATRFAKINAQIARKVASTGGIPLKVSESGPTGVTAKMVSNKLAEASTRLKTIHNTNVQKKINASEAMKKSKVNIAQRQVNAEKNFQTRKLAPFDTKIKDLGQTITSKETNIRLLDKTFDALNKIDIDYNTKRKIYESERNKQYISLKKDRKDLQSTQEEKVKVSAYHQRFVNQATQRVRRQESVINVKRPLTFNQLKEKAANDTALGFSGRMVRDFKAALSPPRIQQSNRFISTKTLLRKGKTITNNNFKNKRAYIDAYVSRLTEKTRPEKLTAIELEIEKLTNLYPPGTSKIKLAIDELSGTKRKRNKRIDLLEEKRKRFLKAVDKLTSLKKLNNKALTKIATQVSNTVAAAAVVAAGVAEKLASTPPTASTTSTPPATPTALVKAPAPSETAAVIAEEQKIQSQLKQNAANTNAKRNPEPPQQAVPPEGPGRGTFYGL